MPRLLLVACCLFSASLARADAPRRDSRLLVQPFGAFDGATVTYDQVIDDRWTWGIGGGFSFLHNDTTFGSTASTALLGNVAVVPAISRYLTGRAPEGLFLRGRLALGLAPQQLWTSAEPDFRYSVGADALVGYSVVLGNGFCAEVGFGLGTEYSWLDTTAASSAGGAFEGLTNRQFVVGSRALAAVGWAF